MKPESKRRHDALLETFQAVDACLRCYYAGDTAIYRPLASQLRLLYCDRSKRRDNSLLRRSFEDLRLAPVKPIEWVPVADLPTPPDPLGNMSITASNPAALVVARMPFTVTEYTNGLAVADLDLEEDAPPITLTEWLQRKVTIHPGLLTVGNIIVSVATKGGGAHFDDYPDQHLRHLTKLRPTTVGSQVLFTVAIGRFTQSLGIHYAQFRVRVGYDGDVGALVLDPEHPTVKSMARVDPTIVARGTHQISLFAVKNIGHEAVTGCKVSPPKR